MSTLTNYGATTRSTRSLPNGVLVGGVANFYTNTKPVVRIDGSALVTGDLWFNPSTCAKSFWNGTYWLNSSRTIISNFSTPNFANFGVMIVILPSSSFFIEEVIFGGYYLNGSQPNWSGSNSFVLNFQGSNGSAIANPIAVDSVVNVTQQSTTHHIYRQVVPLNAAFTSTSSNTAIVIMGNGRVGSPTDTRSSASVVLYGRTIL